MTIRPFEERDYDRQAAIAAGVDPELARGAEWYRHRNQRWDPGLHRLRLVAEHGNQVVGYGKGANMWWTYQPRALKRAKSGRQAARATIARVRETLRLTSAEQAKSFSRVIGGRA